MGMWALWIDMMKYACVNLLGLYSIGWCHCRSWHGVAAHVRLLLPSARRPDTARSYRPDFLIGPERKRVPSAPRHHRVHQGFFLWTERPETGYASDFTNDRIKFVWDMFLYCCVSHLSLPAAQVTVWQGILSVSWPRGASFRRSHWKWKGCWICSMYTKR